MMQKEDQKKAQNIEIEVRLLQKSVLDIESKVKRNLEDIESLEDSVTAHSKILDNWEGGMSWIYKGVFVITTLIGAFLALSKGA